MNSCTNDVREIMTGVSDYISLVRNDICIENGLKSLTFVYIIIQLKRCLLFNKFTAPVLYLQ